MFLCLNWWGQANTCFVAWLPLLGKHTIYMRVNIYKHTYSLQRGSWLIITLGFPWGEDFPWSQDLGFPALSAHSSWQSIRPRAFSSQVGQTFKKKTAKQEPTKTSVVKGSTRMLQHVLSIKHKFLFSIQHPNKWWHKSPAWIILLDLPFQTNHIWKYSRYYTAFFLSLQALLGFSN